METSVTIIGRIDSQLKQLEDCPLQENENAPEADIVLFPGFVEGIQNISAGSEILLLIRLHMADRSVIKCIPRRNYDAPQIGVFSTRSPDRPNPVGIHKVKVVSVKNGVIKVSGLEVLDKTPIIDIKPIWNE